MEFPAEKRRRIIRLTPIHEASTLKFSQRKGKRRISVSRPKGYRGRFSACWSRREEGGEDGGVGASVWRAGWGQVVGARKMRQERIHDLDTKHASRKRNEGPRSKLIKFQGTRLPEGKREKRIRLKKIA